MSEKEATPRSESVGELAEELANYLREEGEQELAATWVISALKERLVGRVGTLRAMSWPPPKGEIMSERWATELEEAWGGIQDSLSLLKSKQDDFGRYVARRHLAVEVARGLLCMARFHGTTNLRRDNARPPSDSEVSRAVCKQFDSLAGALMIWINNNRRRFVVRIDMRA